MRRAHDARPDPSLKRDEHASRPAEQLDLATRVRRVVAHAIWTGVITATSFSTRRAPVHQPPTIKPMAGIRLVASLKRIDSRSRS